MGITRFVFWNIRRSQLVHLVTPLVTELDVDFLILAESTIPQPAVVAALNSTGGMRFWAPHPLAEGLQTFTRLPRSDTAQVFDDRHGHLSVTEFHRGAGPNILLAAFHHQSKLHWDATDQMLHATHVARLIRHLELDRGHQRTILMGDLNMNPFEAGVVAAHGLHAVMTRDFASVRERKVDAESFSMFYNPMWRFFGDDRTGPPGTYWFRTSRPLVYDWNMFDQVLLRPDLMDAMSDVRIIERIGSLSLLKRGRPDQRVGSDHLPLFVEIDL